MAATAANGSGDDVSDDCISGWILDRHKGTERALRLADYLPFVLIRTVRRYGTPLHSRAFALGLDPPWLPNKLHGLRTGTGWNLGLLPK
jgi:hypothetical protein